MFLTVSFPYTIILKSILTGIRILHVCYKKPEYQNNRIRIYYTLYTFIFEFPAYNLYNSRFST